MDNYLLKQIETSKLEAFTKLLDGSYGFKAGDLSFMEDKTSRAYYIALFCVLIAKGELYIHEKKIVSKREFEHDSVIDFMNGFFKGLDLVNFTDLLFLDSIINGLCDGNLDLIHLSWLEEREDFSKIKEIRESKGGIIKVPTAYLIEVYGEKETYDYSYFLLNGKKYNTIIDFLGLNIFWVKDTLTVNKLKNRIGKGNSRIKYTAITLDEFYSRYFDIITLEISISTLN